MNAVGGIGSAGATSHRADAWSASHLGVGISHIGCTAFMAADNRLDTVCMLVESIEQVEKALSRHTEKGIYTQQS